VLAFHCCDKIPEINNLKGGKSYFGWWFERFQFMVTWSCCFGSLARQNMMVEITWLSRASHIMASGKQKRQRELGSLNSLQMHTSQ
jgi:hypothetical protein